MTTAKAVIASILKGDEELRDMLPNRKSIYPAGLLRGDSKYPAITIQAGPVVRDGEFKNINEFYVRVYDVEENGTIYIDKIGYRILQLLDRTEFEIERGRFIKSRFQDSLGELSDPSLDKHFIQYRYRITSV